MQDRMIRVQEAIKREISVLFVSEVNDEIIKYVTVTKVEVSRDLKSARVFYTYYLDDVNDEDVSKSLKKASSFLRHELAERVSMKFIPSLTFYKDSDQEKKESIEGIFKKIENEHINGIGA